MKFSPRGLSMRTRRPPAGKYVFTTRKKYDVEKLLHELEETVPTIRSIKLEHKSIEVVCDAPYNSVDRKTIKSALRRHNAA